MGEFAEKKSKEIMDENVFEDILYGMNNYIRRYRAIPAYKQKMWDLFSKWMLHIAERVVGPSVCFFFLESRRDNFWGHYYHDSVPIFFYFLKENSYAIVLAKLSFSSRRERSQIGNLMQGDWGYAPTSEYDGAFMRRNTPLATLFTTVRTRLSHGSARRNVGRNF